MNKFLSGVALISAALLCTGIAHAQPEQQIKTELQKKLGANAKVKSVSPAPVSGLYEVLVGNDIFYTDSSGKYLIQGEIIELATGKNVTEQRQADLNRIKWSDLTPANAIKNVRGNGSRQLAVFSDPNCGYCKRLRQHLHLSHSHPIDRLRTEIKTNMVLCRSVQGLYRLDG